MFEKSDKPEKSEKSESLISSKNLADQVAQIIGASVVNGELTPDGGFITEMDISAKYGISRNVAREAVKILSGKGLIFSRQKRGIQPTSSDSWNWFDEDILNWAFGKQYQSKQGHSRAHQLAMRREIAELRFAIEPEASAMAALERSDAALSTMATALQRLEVAEDPVDFEEAVMLYHITIIEACENRFYRKLANVLRKALEMSAAAARDNGEVSAERITEQRELLGAITQSDAEQARVLVRTMLERELRAIRQQMVQSAEPA